MTSADREPLPVMMPDAPDAHGQAAMLLVESLIHSLVARAVITVGDAIEIVTVAMDAKVEIAADAGAIDDSRDRALALLSSVNASLGMQAAD